MVQAYAAYSGLTLTASYRTGTSGCAGTLYSGTLADGGAAAYFSSPAGFAALGGAQSGKLVGASGTDFDLYLQKLTGSGWSDVAWGETDGSSNENVTHSGTSGTYRWEVYPYSGGGSFTLCTSKP